MLKQFVACTLVASFALPLQVLAAAPLEGAAYAKDIATLFAPFASGEDLARTVWLMHGGSDLELLKKLRKMTDGQAAPKITADGNKLYIEGFSRAITIVDASKGMFLIGKEKFTFEAKRGFDDNFARLEKILNSKKAHQPFPEMVFPVANAMSTAAAIALGVYAGIGGVTFLGCNFMMALVGPHGLFLRKLSKIQLYGCFMKKNVPRLRSQIKLA